MNCLPQSFKKIVSHLPIQISMDFVITITHMKIFSQWKYVLIWLLYSVVKYLNLLYRHLIHYEIVLSWFTYFSKYHESIIASEFRENLEDIFCGHRPWHNNYPNGKSFFDRKTIFTKIRPHNRYFYLLKWFK